MFVIGQRVLTPYGPGIIKSIREHDVVVEPSTWEMARGQKPIFYMNSKDVQPDFQVKDQVSCAFGIGTIIDVRSEDEIFVVQLNNWKLATGKSPTLFLNKSSIQFANTLKPQTFSVGQDVSCSFGIGTILELRKSDGIIVINLKNWKLANGKSPTLYLNSSSIQPIEVDNTLNSLQIPKVHTFTVGETVNCSFGLAQIKEIRASDGMFILTLNNWKLANGKSPTLYLNRASIKELPTSGSSTEEPPVPRESYVQICLKRCIASKAEAAEHFKAGRFSEAKGSYLEALGEIRYLGESLNNEEKAQVLEQTIPIHNNISIVSFKLESYIDSAAFAKNTVMLTDALESRIPKGEVWKALLARNENFERTFVEWKKKGLYFLGKAEVKKGNYSDAMSALEDYVRYSDDDRVPYLPPRSSSPSSSSGPPSPSSSSTTAAQKVLSEVKDLIKFATKKRDMELKKEKDTWSKAFQKSTKEYKAQEKEEEEEKQAVAEVMKSTFGKASSSLGLGLGGGGVGTVSNSTGSSSSTPPATKGGEMKLDFSQIGLGSTISAALNKAPASTSSESSSSSASTPKKKKTTTPTTQSTAVMSSNSFGFSSYALFGLGLFSVFGIASMWWMRGRK